MTGVLGSVLIVSYSISKCLPTSEYLSKWVCTWLIFTSIINVWNIGFVLNRPTSIYNPIWSLSYGIYTQVDTLYLDMNDNFIYSVSLINGFEVLLNCISLLTLGLRHFRAAGIIALIVSSMTLSKTIMYLLMEIVSGFEHTKQNNGLTFLTFYIFPNMLWILIPTLAIYVTSAAFIKERPSKKEK